MALPTPTPAPAPVPQAPPLSPGAHPGDRIDAYALAPIGTLLGIATVTTALRIYWRMRPTWRMGMDDYTLVFALIISMAWYAIDIVMYQHGRGTEGFLPNSNFMGPLVVADGVLWVWGLNMIRISVAFMLLRLKDSLPWKVALWSIIGLQVAMVIVGTTMHLVMCRPISARWNPLMPGAVCIDKTYFQAYGYVYSGFTIASDFILSLMPITFIRALKRPLHEKILIGCLMAAGMAATGVAIARLVLIMGALGKQSAMLSIEQDLLWGMELTVGVLTASLPTLKAPVHRLLLSSGLLRSQPSANERSPDSFLGHLTNGSHITRQMRQWDTPPNGSAEKSADGSSDTSLQGSSPPGSARNNKEGRHNDLPPV